jgi:hypothetical protein
MAKMTDRELIRLALLDALSWRHALADASAPDTGSRKAYVLRAQQYRDMLDRKYNDSGVTPGAATARSAEMAVLRAGLK